MKKTIFSLPSMPDFNFAGTLQMFCQSPVNKYQYIRYWHRPLRLKFVTFSRSKGKQKD